ncbi:unnamed protein product [Rotaria socialis]
MMTTACSSLFGDNHSPSPVISFVMSQKEKPLLVSDEYIFKLNKTTTTSKYWICADIACSAKIHTNTNNQLTKMTGEHSHVPEKETIAVREFREKIKQRVIEETTPIPRIYDEECAKATLSTAAIAVLPSEHSAINKARRAVTPIIPTTQLFDIPGPFARTLRDNTFLTIDKLITRRQMMILFASDEQLKMLFSAETILMDGTFSSCPKIFDQVYTKHSIKYEQSFPCVFGLLPNRFKPTYQFLFHELKFIAIQMKLDFAPKIVMSDFEPALMGVVKTECSNSFLLLFPLYSGYIPQLMTLPLLPEPVIEDTYDELVRDLPTNMSETMKRLLEYFQEQWFAKVPVSQWCVHAFHSRFNRRVLVHHPNIWSFIKFLQGEESRFYHMNIQFSAGLDARAKQARTMAIQRHIDCLDRRYYDGVINTHIKKYAFLHRLSQKYTYQQKCDLHQCGGCSEKFCWQDLPKHHQEHVLELEKIGTDCDAFQQKVNEQQQDLNHRPLIQQVNEWERDSIMKIKQRAEDCRQRLIKSADDNIIKMKMKLNQFIADLRKMRDDDDFNEIHLNRLRLLLEELKKKREKPLNVSILEEPTSFINKISISG